MSSRLLNNPESYKIGLAFLDKALQDGSLMKYSAEQRRIAIWKAFDRYTESQQRPFRAGLRKLFRRQKEEVLARLETAAKAVDPGNVLPDELLRNWRVRFSEFGQLLLPEVIEDAGARALATIIAEASFNVNNPRVAQYIDQKAYKFSFEVNNTTMKLLRNELSTGVDAGESIYKLRKRIEKVFGFSERYRTERIARTEVIGASNFGNMEAYRQSGVVEGKEWLSTKDSRVRDSHAAMDGERKPLEERFSNGLMQPGDMAGPPEEIINCRCTTVPVMIGELTT